MKKISILTGGGDCPGLNAVIRAVVRRAIGTYNLEVLGIREGWGGLIYGYVEPLTHYSITGILPRGGTKSKERGAEREKSRVLRPIAHVSRIAIYLPRRTS